MGRATGRAILRFHHGPLLLVRVVSTTSKRCSKARVLFYCCQPVNFVKHFDSLSIVEFSTKEDELIPDGEGDT